MPREQAEGGELVWLGEVPSAPLSSPCRRPFGAGEGQRERASSRRELQLSVESVDDEQVFPFKLCLITHLKKAEKPLSFLAPRTRGSESKIRTRRRMENRTPPTT